MHPYVRCALLSIALVAAAAPAGALPTGYDIQIAVANSQTGASMGGADLASLMSAGVLTETVDPVAGTTTLALNTVVAGPSGLWTIDEWDSTIDLDPFITNNFTVTNNTAATLTYTIAVSSPIPAFNADEIVQSTIQLRLLDSNGIGGALVTSSAGTDVYEAFVNGSKALGLLTDPFSLSCTDPIDCTINGTAAAGVASQAFGPAVATSIGLTITFDLTPGNSASILSRFELVPEPGTALLVGIGLVGLAGARRHRRA
ncbi:MAG: PEP-CTERM sorting domain-containing protein [Myxococcota bacterium]